MLASHDVELMDFNQKSCQMKVCSTDRIEDILAAAKIDRRLVKSVFISGKQIKDFTLSLSSLDHPARIGYCLTTDVSQFEICFNEHVVKIKCQDINVISDISKHVVAQFKLPPCCFHLMHGCKILAPEDATISSFGIFLHNAKIEVFFNFPEVVQRVNNRAPQQICAICLNELGFDITSNSNCSHCFHIACAEKIDKCPLCRAPWIQ